MRKLIFLISILSIIWRPSYAQDFYSYYTRLGAEDKISGKYSDVVICLGEKGQFVFSRESSYLPYFENVKGKWFVKEVVKRKGDGSGLKPDKYNRHTYVRIIKNTPEKIIVQWRYYPNILKTGMTDVVHEFYTFYPDGRVRREIKIGTKKIDDWNSLKYDYAFNLRLENGGIKVIGSQKSHAKILTESVIGNPVNRNMAKVAAYWSFDEGAEIGGDKVTESVSNITVPVLGHKTYWKPGVSGTSLQFDGYFSGVKFPMSYAPNIGEEFTIEAWINMEVHPFGWVPIVQQANWGKAGYYLGVNARGNIGFIFNDAGDKREVISKDVIENSKWYHLAITFNDEEKKVILFVNGEIQAESTVEVKGWSSLVRANAPVSIGINSDKLIATPGGKYVYGQYACITGFQGLIDEVKYFNEALSPEKVKDEYNRIVLDSNSNQTLFEKRILPGHPGYADNFGAYYTKLTFSKMWDDAWRTSDYADIIVKFDELPTSVVFWRGTSYGAGWVTDKNLWMIDQSVELVDAISFSEHMSDKQGRYSHVRLIENTNARVVVHWRYNSNDVLYSFTPDFGPAGVWVDEYITIFPDGIGIRKVEQKSLSWVERPPTKISWQDVQFLAQPGMTPDDVMNLEAVHLANMKGETAKMDWTNGVPQKNPLPDANIELINLKSRYKVFLAFQHGTFINPWGRVPKHMYCHFMTWNHWPVSFITSQGKSSLFPDRVTHSALCAADNAVDHGNMAMYGFTDKPVERLIPLVKSWNFPPSISKVKGGKSFGYNKEQRSFLFESAGSEIYFSINASEENPVFNPCFEIKKWGGEKADLKLNGKLILSGKTFRQGIVRDVDGSRKLVVWLKYHSEKPVTIEIFK